MSSLGRLTLELSADPTQLNRDLDAVRAHAQAVARDIETSLRNAFRAGSAGMPSAGSGGGGGSSSSPFAGLRSSLTSFISDVRTAMGSLRSLSFSGLITSARTAFGRLPGIASIAVRGLPLALTAVGVIAGTRLGSAVVSAAKTGLEKLKGLAQSIGQSFSTTFSNALNAVSFGAFAAAGMGAFNTVTGVISNSIAKVQEFGKGLFDTLKEVQKFDAQLKTFVKDDTKREDLNKRLNEFSATTPFELKDIRKSAISALSTMPDPGKVNIEKYMADLKALGDVAAGAQQPVGELADKFAKARSEGRAQNEDLQEWAGRGIPIYQELGKILGATSAEVRQMATDGKINFEELNQAVSSMTQEGGVYFKAMENQSKTLEGKLSNISDTFYQFKENLSKAFEPLANLGADIFGEMVSGLSDAKGVMADIKKETQVLADYFKENPEIAKALNKSLQDIVKGAMKGLVNAVKIFAEFLKENPNIIKQIATEISRVTKTISKAVSFAVDLASTFGGAVLSQIEKNQDLFNGIITTVQDIIKFAIELASVYGGAVLEALNQNNTVTDGLRSLVESLIGLWNNNKEAIALVGQAIGELIGTALNIVIKLVVGILNYLKEHPAIIQAIATGIQLVAKIFEGIAIFIGKILEGIGWIVNKITDWANSSVPVQNFFTGVSNAINVIITGMDDIVNKTIDWLKNLEPVKAALDAISSLGTGSNEEASSTGNETIHDSMQEMIKGMDGGGSTMGGAKKADDFVGAVLSILEAPTRQGRVDVAQVISNRVGTNFGGYGANVRDQAFASGQFQPFFKETYGIGKNDIRDEASAIQALQKAGYSLKTAQEAINNFFSDISDTAKVADSQSKVGGRAYFKGTTQQAYMRGDDFLRNKNENFFHHEDGDMKNRKMSTIGSIFGTGGSNNTKQQTLKFNKARQINNPGGGYKIVEAVGSTVENVNSYQDLEKHHPSSGREAGRDYATVAGEFEEVRNVGGGKQHVKKDFVLIDKNGNQAVGMPSPASGIVSYIGNPGAVVIADENGNRLGAALHMTNIKVKVGDRVSYGQILGTQSDVGSEGAVHSHVELPVENFRKYISDLQSGSFGSTVQSSNNSNKSLPKFNEKGITSSSQSNTKTTQSLSSGNTNSRGTPSISSTSVSSSSPSTVSIGSSGSSIAKTPVSAIQASPQAKRDLLTARQKQQESLYKEISEEIKFSQRSENAADKQKRELEDTSRKREQEQAKAKLQLQVASAETPEAKKILERNLARFDVDAKYKDEDIKLQRQRDDLVKSRDNKVAALKKAEERKAEFIAQKKKNGEEYTEADLEKFKVSPDEGSMMDFSKAIKDIDKMIESQKTLKALELQTLGISESADDRKERRAKQRERDIEQIKREGDIEINNLKKLESSVTDENLKKQLQDKISQTELKIQAKIELMPIEDQLEDLSQTLGEVLAAGVKQDSPEAQEIQKQIDELNKQKTSIASKSGVDLAVFENERKQAEVERNREKTAQNNELLHRTKIAEFDNKIANARSDFERASLNAEKQRLELLKSQSDEQLPLLDKLADLQKDKNTLISSGVKESSEEMKILDDSIKSVNQQLSLLKSEGSTAMATLTKETTRAIEEAKRADASRLIEKDSLMSGSDLSSARLEQMRENNANPYKTSALEKEIAMSQEALRYRQEMLDIEEKIASFRGTNAELSAAEENQLRNNAAAIHQINIEKVQDNVRTLGKDLTDMGKGAVKDFFGQLVSGSMDFNSIIQNVISQLGNLAVELIQSQLFGEDGIFGKKKKKSDDSSGGLGDGLFNSLLGNSKEGGGLFGNAGASPMQPAFVSVVGGAGSLGGILSTGKASGNSDSLLDIILGGGGNFNTANPLPINMVSANKDAFSGLGDIFSGIFGGGGNSGIGSIFSGLFGGGSNDGGGGLGGLFSILPSIFGFAEGGKVQGLSIDKLPMDNHPISKALRAENLASGKKPILAVLHEGELVLNREQQERAGIFDVPRFDSGGIVGSVSNNITKANQNTINMTFNTSDGDTGGLDVNALRAVINQEMIRQQGSGGIFGRGSYSRRGR